MINTIRDEIITALADSLTSYAFYKRISERVTEFPAIIVDLRSDTLTEAGTNDSKKAYNTVNNFDIWCIHSEIRNNGATSKSIDTAEIDTITGIYLIRDILQNKYKERIDFSTARYDEVYINGGHQFAGILTVKIMEIVEHG